jgi:DNA-binding GntR family transcriptional regulator
MFKITKNLSDQIADHLIEKIIRFEISPGDRLLEQKVAEELGVSRSPVREAFRILEKTGLVQLVPRCGVKVTSLSEKRVESFCDVFTLLFSHVVRR